MSVTLTECRPSAESPCPAVQKMVSTSGSGHRPSAERAQNGTRKTYSTTASGMAAAAKSIRKNHAERLPQDFSLGGVIQLFTFRLH